jgi:tRNA 2-thiocytidine biosynthesis protein TtcA
MSSPDRVASFLLKPVARACKEFALLAEGDRVAVAVSGGKDSCALLDLLLRYQERVPFSYKLVALHVVGTAAGLPDLTEALEPWLKGLGVDYRLIPLELPADEPLPLDCFRCSWNRRKTLFLAADDMGCNKLALGHHADDAAITALLNLLFTGRLETLEPKISFFNGKITVVRPLIYVPAKELDRYARTAGFPLAPPCPHESDSCRQQITEFLRSFGPRQAMVRANIWRAARNQLCREGPDGI